MFVHFSTDVKSRYNALDDNGESKISLLIRGITSGYNDQIKKNAIRLEPKLKKTGNMNVYFYYVKYVQFTLLHQ